MPKRKKRWRGGSGKILELYIVCKSHVNVQSSTHVKINMYESVIT